MRRGVPPEHLEPLRGLAEIVCGSEDSRLLPRAEVLRLAPRLDAIINQGELRVDAELLDAAPRLRVVANIAIGFDNLDTALMAGRGVWATNVPGAFTAATADATLGLLLCLARRLAEADRYVRSGRWAEDGFRPGDWDGLLLAGRTLGIVGYGAIGQAVARRARAFDMRVIHHRRRQSSDPDYRTLDALLAESDVVSLHVPLNDQTRRLLDAARLGRMRRGALLVNMARGPVVDEGALVAALQSGHLAGAALDVFEHEPRAHPALLAMPQVVLAPHLGGSTTESRALARRTCARNVAAVLRGQEPPNPVNRPHGNVTA